MPVRVLKICQCGLRMEVKMSSKSVKTTFLLEIHILPSNPFFAFNPYFGLKFIWRLMKQSLLTPSEKNLKWVQISKSELTIFVWNPFGWKFYFETWFYLVRGSTLAEKMCAFDFLKSADTSKLQSGHMLLWYDTCIQRHGRSKRETKRLKRSLYMKYQTKTKN